METKKLTKFDKMVICQSALKYFGPLDVYDMIEKFKLRGIKIEEAELDLLLKEMVKDRFWVTTKSDVVGMYKYGR